MADASIYLACKDCGVPKTLNDLCREAGYVTKKGGDEVDKQKRKDISRSVRCILKGLNKRSVIQNPRDYIPKIIENYSMPNKGIIEGCANKIIIGAKRNRELSLLAGRDPQSMAAAACYIAGNMIGEGWERKEYRHTMTQKSISDITGKTEVTIRNRYKELKNKLTFVVYL